MRIDIPAEINDWPIRRLGELSSITLGGTPSTSVSAFWNGDVPWMSSGEVNLRHVWNVQGRITERGLRSSNATLVEPPAVAVGLAGQGRTRGTVALVHVALCTNQSVALIKGSPSDLDTRFLFHNLDARFEELRARSSGGGRGGLSRTLLAAVPVAVPPLGEQRRIADILDILDDAIRKTEQVIAKLRQMKLGLLHDLLTRGIDEHGELRDPGRHPEQFKDSPLGRIPKAWGVKALGECLLRSPQNGLYKPASAIGAGALMVGQTAFTASKSIDYSLARRAAVSRSEIGNWGLTEGDVLVSRVFATVEGVGQPVLVPPPPEPAVYESNMMRLKVDTAVIRSELLFHWLRDSRVRRHVVANANSSNQTSINQVGLCRVPIARPSPAEQEAILAAAAAATRREERERAEAEKLRTLKHGLMDDLLTGRVRVAVPREAA